MDIAGSRLLHDMFEHGVAVHPDKLVLIHESAEGQVQQFSYGDFAARLAQVCHGFTRLGITRGANVVVMMANNPEFLLTWLALSRIGAVMVPVNTANTAAELAYIADFTEARHIVADDKRMGTVGAVPGNDRSVICVGRPPATAHPRTVPWDAVWQGQPTTFTAARQSNEELVEILFTNGTTADPKGVEVTHALAVWCGESWSRNVRLVPEERCMTALPLFHLNAQATALAVLCVGATLVLIENFSASRYWQQARTHRANLVAMVSAYLRTVLAQPPQPQDREHAVRAIPYGLNCTDAEKLAFETRFGTRLSNGYGLSEAFLAVTKTPLNAPERWPSVGMPTMGREVRVVDAQGRELPPGEIGEVVVSGVPGRTLFRGYYKNPAATAETLRDGWLHTGDQAWFDADGYLYFYERSKDVIKRGGENISASEVEAKLLLLPEVLECAVIAVADPIKDQAVKACVVLRPGATLTAQQVQAHCARHLAAFKVPQFVEFHDALPKTSIGKIAKKTLRAQNA